jgi:uncharacterized protein
MIALGHLLMKTDEAFLQGVGLFNAGRFFEAHEEWERLWLSSKEPAKSFLQGMIQIAAAFHHYDRGNLRGAKSLLASGFARIQTMNECGDMALREFLAEISEWIELLKDGRISADRTPPRIRVERARS